MNPSNLPILFLVENPGARLPTLSAAQLWLQNHEWGVEAFWWLTYAGVLAYLVSRFIVLPLLARSHGEAKTNTPRKRR